MYLRQNVLYFNTGTTGNLENFINPDDEGNGTGSWFWFKKSKNLFLSSHKLKLENNLNIMQNVLFKLKSLDVYIYF